MMNITTLKHTLRHIYRALLCVCVLSSCSHEEVVQEPLETFTLSFQLTTNGIFSRSDIWEPPHDDDETGTSFDNTINSVDIFLVGDGNSLTRLYALEEPGDQHIYTCEVNEKTPGVTIDKANRTATFTGKIMVLANVEYMDSPIFTSGTLGDDEIPYRMRFGIYDDWKIPMWGVQSFSNVNLESGIIKYLGDIHMLRAVSKIIIKLDESIQGDYEIEKIEMSEGSPKFFGNGFALPKNGLTVASTLYLSRENCFNRDPNAETIDTPKFEKVDKSAVYTYGVYTYVSESQTEVSESETDVKPFSFDVTLKSKKEGIADFKGTLKFSKYDTLNPANPGTPIMYAVRNHIYEFTITLAELKLLPTVKDWEMGGTIHIDCDESDNI